MSQSNALIKFSTSHGYVGFLLPYIVSKTQSLFAVSGSVIIFVMFKTSCRGAVPFC
jgi:hypothetical protein